MYKHNKFLVKKERFWYIEHKPEQILCQIEIYLQKAEIEHSLKFDGSSQTKRNIL